MVFLTFWFFQTYVKIHQIENKTHTDTPSRGALNVEPRPGKGRAAVSVPSLLSRDLVSRHTTASSPRGEDSACAVLGDYE